MSELTNTKGVCEVKGCERPMRKRTYCWRHYAQALHNQPLTKLRHYEKHGKTGSSEYQTWKGMRERCYDPNSTRYYRYGGRGITVCDSWRESFTTFYADMGAKPFKGATIERVDNDKGYFPNNCIWLSRKENNRTNSNCKLNVEQVKKIRAEYSTNSRIKNLATKYNVTERNIHHIIAKETWDDI